jgi:hypothetical protein
VNRRKLSPSDVVILAAGAITLIGSFLAFYEIPFGTRTAEVNAWDNGLFLIRTLPALLGTVMALQILLVAFGNITMPNRVLGLTWDQFHLVVALQTAVLMLALLLQTRPTVFVEQIEFGPGFWLMLIGAGGLVLGALMRLAASRRRPRAL